MPRAGSMRQKDGHFLRLQPREPKQFSTDDRHGMPILATYPELRPGCIRLTDYLESHLIWILLNRLSDQRDQMKRSALQPRTGFEPIFVQSIQLVVWPIGTQLGNTYEAICSDVVTPFLRYMAKDQGQEIQVKERK